MTDREPILGIRRELRVTHAPGRIDSTITPTEPIAVRGYDGDHELFRCTIDYTHGYEHHGSDETFATRAYLEALPRESTP